MTVHVLDFAEPFFTVRLIEDAEAWQVEGRAILLNLADRPILIHGQRLPSLQSAIVADTPVEEVSQAVVVERFDAHSDEAALFGKVRALWPTAFEVRGEERLRGVGHYMSPKVWVGRVGLTMYHAATVPLNVGLHREHPFCPVPGFREVHTQIVGIGRMQQARARNPGTVYLEEMMAPGHTHRPMWDENGDYPWHQYETVTPGIFMAVEMLPEGAAPPS